MSYADRDGWIWYDGDWKPWRDATTHVLTHTLHYGVGVFEGIRAYQTNEGAAIFRLDAHLIRLYNSAKIMKMAIPYEESELTQAAKMIVTKNNLSNAYIRPLCFYGAESMGLHATDLQTHVIFAAWDWGSYLGKDKLINGVNLKTSSFIRTHINSIFTKAKTCGNYVNSVLAMNEAQTNGADEALLLDNQGYVAEGSGENFFMVEAGIVITPPTTAILAGITRDTIIKLCQDSGLTVKEQYFTRDRVYTADEAFLSGTAAEITPVSNLDGRQIGAGKRGPITQQIQDLYFDIVHNRQSNYKHWLSYCEKT